MDDYVRKGVMVFKFLVIVGYEIIGVVERIGEGVITVKLGMRMLSY